MFILDELDSEFPRFPRLLIELRLSMSGKLNFHSLFVKKGLLAWAIKTSFEQIESGIFENGAVHCE